MNGFIVFFAILAACSGHKQEEYKAIAVLEGGKDCHGNVTFTQKYGEPVHIDISISGLKPGSHGFHVHEKGDLSNGCLSMAGHYNPEKVNHGAPKDDVRHVGDLGNVVADDKGYVNVQITDTVISLIGEHSILGRGVVVHDGEDDLGRTEHPDSKKTGNAGGRAACGVIGVV